MRLFPRVLGIAVMAFGLCQAVTVWADLTVDPNAVHTVVPNGEDSLACTDLIVHGAGLVALNGGSIVQIRHVQNSGTIDGTPSGTLEVNGDWVNNGIYVAAGSTVKLRNQCSVSTLQLTGSTTFNNLDIAGQGSTPITVVLPGPNTVATKVSGALTFSNSAAPVTITGPNCAGILVNSKVQLPGNVTLDSAKAIWIDTQPPASCGGGSPSMAPVPIPGMGWTELLLLSLLMEAAVAWRGRHMCGRRSHD